MNKKKWFFLLLQCFVGFMIIGWAQIAIFTSGNQKALFWIFFLDLVLAALVGLLVMLRSEAEKLDVINELSDLYEKEVKENTKREKDLFSKVGEIQKDYAEIDKERVEQLNSYQLIMKKDRAYQEGLWKALGSMSQIFKSYIWEMQSKGSPEFCMKAVADFYHTLDKKVSEAIPDLNTDYPAPEQSGQKK